MKTLLAVLVALAITCTAAYADCPNSTIYCFRNDRLVSDRQIGTLDAGQCWKLWFPGCQLCNDQRYWTDRCNTQFIDCKSKDSSGNVTGCKACGSSDVTMCDTKGWQ